MKRLFFYLLIAIIVSSCGNQGNGELIGVQDRPVFYQTAPYGMSFIPLGSFTMGSSDQDVPYAHVHEPKTVSIASFYMDETEITNNEYRQFVNWVRDSIARRVLVDNGVQEYQMVDDAGTPLAYPNNEPVLNWEEEIGWGDDGSKSGGTNLKEILDQEMFYPMVVSGSNNWFYNKKVIDARKLYYTYYWVDYQKAAKKIYSPISGGVTPGSDPNMPSQEGGFANRPRGNDPNSYYNNNDPFSSFINQENVNIYPDTLVWVFDFTYSFNEPMLNYFWHPAYDNYPVVGVSWKQAKAFASWRTSLMNTWLNGKGEVAVNEFRLPSEAEWEWAARGGWEMNPFPWGGPYLRNDKGCFLANFKPSRGNYVSDGGIQTLIVAHYAANDWGLYDMAGNVSEWTNSAFDESTFNFTWDMNPNYEYNAAETDPPQMKKKVLRGGSWKDVGYFLQVTARQYEYQDTAKAYIGFRCIQTFLGRMANDDPKNSSEIYR